MEPIDSPWKVSGFGTLGMVSQSGGNGWGFTRNITQLGANASTSATQDSRLGLQLNWSSGTQWEGGIQGVAVRKPSGTPARDYIEWAYLGYRPWPNARLRIGRTSPDLFLFADSRNVGFALPWARPPVDFYGFVPLVSIDGADFEQHWFTNESTWRARVTAGSIDTSVTTLDGSRAKLQGRQVGVLGLSREQGGLLLKASYARSQQQITTGSDPALLRQGLSQLATLPVPGLANTLDRLAQNLWTAGPTSYLALATQYETGPWTLIAEASQLRVPGSPLNARRAYISAGYRQGNVTYYGLASQVKPRNDAVTEPDLASSLTPILGAQGAAQAQALAGYAAAAGDRYRFDQRTIGVGLRWDFAPNAALKLQVDRFNINRHGAAGWRDSDGRAAQGTLVSVLVDFVWGQ
ncbi:MAG: hypothetical protein EOP13_25540 [Pseudomonas sp.]|nr:MAG: hypothetical protein EOP13_25540 [Pseudomonas sp.]